MGGRGTGHSSERPLPCERLDADLWPLVTEAWVSLQPTKSNTFIALTGRKESLATAPLKCTQHYA